VSLLFGPQIQLVVTPQSLALGQAAGTAITITDMRMEFDVKKGSGKHPNKCVIKVINLSPDSRALLDRKPLRVVLHAGYDGVLKKLFDGDMTRSFTEQVGRVDNVTEIHVGDGVRAFSGARLDRSYRPPVTLRQIVSDAAKSMGMPVPIEVSRPEFSVALPDSVTAASPTRDVLDRALTPFNLSWSIQNGRLTVLTENQIRSGDMYLVNEALGLLGSPKLKESEHAGKGKKTEITFESLLYPELEPGVGVRLESKFVTQNLKITDASSKGDNKPGGKFITSVKGKPIT
jgi:hypothetical protein